MNGLMDGWVDAEDVKSSLFPFLFLVSERFSFLVRHAAVYGIR